MTQNLTDKYPYCYQREYKRKSPACRQCGFAHQCSIDICSIDMRERG